MATSEDRSSSATIFEVAKAAGVSITTVSHVYSGKRPVGADTRRRVEEAAERLAYHPRAAARALASGRTMTLAVQFPLEGTDVLLNAYFSGLVPAMSEPAVVRGYAFVLVPPDPARDAFIEPLIDRRGIDGAVLLDPRAGDAFAAALLEADIPFVSLGRTPDAPDTPRVDQDFAELMRVVAQHLAEQGYERPALLNLPGEFSTLVDIEQAFLAASPNGVALASAEPTDAGAAAAAHQVLDSRDRRRPDVVVVMDARQGAAVYRTAHELGLAIPGDLGVVALEDAMASRMDPSLTSVSLFPEQAGRILIELIDGLLGGVDPPALTLVPFELRPRTSTARRAAQRAVRGNGMLHGG